MWALNNRTAYAAERNWTRGREGLHWWLVAIKATFDIGRDGRLRLADEQLPPALMPEYFGEPGRSSLRFDSDLLAPKPDTDILVNAHAHAPHGRPTPTVPVSLRVGRLHKVLVVHGERTYEQSWSGVTPGRPQPFTARPIRYELAFGGSDLSGPDPAKHRIDERNPIGRGFATRGAHLAGKPAHAIAYPSGDPATLGPAGFGPLDSSWMPRRKLAGTYDARWERTKKLLLPDDFDLAFALSAPVNQRPKTPLQGGEPVWPAPSSFLCSSAPRRKCSVSTRRNRPRVPRGGGPPPEDRAQARGAVAGCHAR